MAGKETRLEEMLAPVVESLGCDFWGLELRMQGKQSLLRIFIEKEAGIAVEDCENVSRQVSSVLDVEDPIAGEYTLEVSSPGMDRPLFTLEQYARYVGENVSLKLRVAFEGRRNFAGALTAIENDEIVLLVDSEEYILPFELIDKARVVPKF